MELLHCQMQFCGYGKTLHASSLCWKKDALILRLFFILLTHEGSNKNLRQHLIPFAASVVRVVKTMGSIHPQPPLPNCSLRINSEPTTRIRQLLKISPTLWVCNNARTALEQYPIQVLTKLNVAWLQWSNEKWYFQVDKPQFSTHLFFWLLRKGLHNGYTNKQ